jgi:hypothetical protein
MLIHAVWEDGKLNLPEHIKPKHTKIKVVVDFPESEIEIEGQESLSITDTELSKKIELLESTRHWSGAWKGEKSDRELLYEGLKMRHEETE